MLIETAITGDEATGSEMNPYHALQKFYQAFNGRQLDLTVGQWSRANEVSMSNPLGGVKRGWREIKQVYEHLFNGPTEVYVEFYDYSIHEAADMFCAVGKERGYFRCQGLEIELAIRTSRVYQLENNQWRHLHHHGSIDDADLLAMYQAAVLNGVEGN